MEGPGGAHYDGIKSTVRKKRSQTSRRPRPDSQVGFFENQGHSPPFSSTPPDDSSKISSDDIPAFDTNPRRKEFSLSQCISRAASLAESERESCDSRRRGLGKGIWSTEGALAPPKWRNSSRVKEVSELEFKGNDVFNGGNGESPGLVDSEGKVKKVKFKVGALTRTVHANGLSNQNVQESSDGCKSPQDKKAGLQGIPWKDFSLGKDGSAMGRPAGKKQGEPTGPVRKSKRVPKRRVLDGEFSEEEDDEIRYLEKLKSRSVSVCKEDNDEPGRRQRKPSGISNGENVGKRKPRSDKASEDLDYEDEEDELVSDNENEGGTKIRKKKKQKKELAEPMVENKREMTLTTRQRAHASSAAGANGIEFPDGLPPAPPRKRKEKLTEVEQQLKKAEAAQRRKMQTEKAARESEAEAIRKILGQDSNRKKREEKIKKRQEELAQEKAANEEMAASSCIRTVMGPNGTTMTFPRDMGFPNLFESKSLSYPPPREKCAGPSCSNPYKYRHSKTNLPLCSLQCYKAVQESVQSEPTS